MQKRVYKWNVSLVNTIRKMSLYNYSSTREDDPELEQALKLSMETYEEDERRRRSSSVGGQQEKRNQMLLAAERRAMLKSMNNMNLSRPLTTRISAASLGKGENSGLLEDASEALRMVEDCWRKQEGTACGRHAVDVVRCVLQEKKSPMTPEEFETLARLDDDLIAMLGADDINESKGMYSIEDITQVLQRLGLRVELDYKRDAAAPMTREPDAVIAGDGRHWWALAKQGTSWFNFDSESKMRSSAVCARPTHLRYFKDGFSGVRTHLARLPPGSVAIRVFQENL